MSYNYFGNDWLEKVFGLKIVEDVLEMCWRIFVFFEVVEKEIDLEKWKVFLIFVIVGVGLIGVELVGVLVELVYIKLKEEYCFINIIEVKIYLI